MVFFLSFHLQNNIAAPQRPKHYQMGKKRTVPKKSQNCRKELLNGRKIRHFVRVAELSEKDRKSVGIVAKLSKKKEKCR